MKRHLSQVIINTAPEVISERGREGSLNKKCKENGLRKQRIKKRGGRGWEWGGQ